jgi:hypothetical protein
MPVMPTDINSDAADPDIGAFRDDHRSVADNQRTGKCWHRQQPNKKKASKAFFMALSLFGWRRFTSLYPPECARGTPKVCIELTNNVRGMSLKKRDRTALRK